MLPIDFELPLLLVINGRQGSGKSHFLKYIMRENYLSGNKFDYGIVFSNTAFEGSFDYIPKKYIFESFDEDILKNLMNIQKNNIKKKIKKRAFVILDDCLDDKDQFNNEHIKKLSTQLRHYNISLIITTQYCHLIPPRMRANAMYSVFFDVGQGVREMKAIYEAYGGRFKNYETFKQFYFKNIEDHKFIMYTSEGYQVYKAPSDIPDFSFKFNKRINKK